VLEGVGPYAVIIWGDTNSILTGALAAAKLHISVAPVETGFRSFDRPKPAGINCMPENRAPTTQANRFLRPAVSQSTTVTKTRGREDAEPLNGGE